MLDRCFRCTSLMLLFATKKQAKPFPTICSPCRYGTIVAEQWRLMQDYRMHNAIGCLSSFTLTPRRLQYKTAKYVPPRLEGPDVALLAGIGSGQLPLA